MGIADLKADNYRLLLEEDSGLSEQMTVFPIGGNKRTVYAVVLEENGARDQRAHHDQQSEIIEVLFHNHATNGLIVAEAVQRLALARTGIGDAESTRFDFQRVVERDALHFVLEFKRSTLTNSGEFTPAGF